MGTDFIHYNTYLHILYTVMYKFLGSILTYGHLITTSYYFHFHNIQFVLFIIIYSQLPYPMIIL